MVTVPNVEASMLVAGGAKIDVVDQVEEIGRELEAKLLVDGEGPAQGRINLPVSWIRESIRSRARLIPEGKGSWVGEGCFIQIHSRMSVPGSDSGRYYIAGEFEARLTRQFDTIPGTWQFVPVTPIGKPVS